MKNTKIQLPDTVSMTRSSQGLSMHEQPFAASKANSAQVMVEPEFKGLKRAAMGLDQTHQENLSNDQECEYKSQQPMRALSDASNLELNGQMQNQSNIFTSNGPSREYLMTRKEFSEGPNLTTSMPQLNHMTRRKIFGAHSMNFDTLQNEIRTLKRDHQLKIEQLETHHQSQVAELRIQIERLNIENIRLESASREQQFRIQKENTEL